MADPATYRPKTADIPTDPGVYRFSDAQGAVIYVGKAKNLRSRLTSYFGRMSGLHERTQRMVKTACHVQWTVVQNELEALQLEYTWIKQFDPRFNVKYRDDKSYPWLAVTTSEEFPRVFVGRGAKKRGNRYFGPYGQAWAIRETVDMLLRVFPMRSCSAGTFRNAASSGRACLLGYIDKCSAPCIGRVTPEEHRQIVDDFCSFMGGQSQTIIRRTEAQMKTAAAALDFENAARLRDDLGALRKASERNSIVLGDGTDADVIALIEDPLEVAIQIFHVRKGRVSGERGWVADRVDDSDLAALMEKFLVQLYADVDDSEIPREILVSALPESAASLEELLAEASGRKVSLRVPQRGDKKNLLETVSRNAAQALIQHKTKRASDLTTRNRALEEIQKALDLPDAPLRIECYDISHTQGTEVVASMVVFEDGLPRKSEYRRFIIRTVEGSDDVGSMREVLLRRFKRWLDDKQVVAEDPEANFDATIGAPRRFAYAPSLVVVDGGLPQVNAAAAVFEELGITDVGLCGLAKRLEELWLPGEEYPTILPRSSEGLYLLQRLRDEAHRFAISHHRGRRSKAMLESELDNIPGLGDTRRKALLQAFGSLKKLRAATVEELQQVPGVGPTLAANVWAALQQGDAPSPIDMSTGELLSDGQ